MGKVYKEIEAKMKVADKVICDHCGRELEKHMDESFNDSGALSPAWFESCFHLKVSWGDYYSEYDQQHHEANICEPCDAEIFKNVKIRVSGMGAPETFPGKAWVRED